MESAENCGAPDEVTPVAVEQILDRVDVEGRMLLSMQGAQSDELLPGTYLARRPAMPPQVLQQRKLLFQIFQFLPHRAVLGSTVRVGEAGGSLQARMVGDEGPARLSETRRQQDLQEVGARLLGQHELAVTEDLVTG